MTLPFGTIPSHEQFEAALPEDSGPYTAIFRDDACDLVMDMAPDFLAGLDIRIVPYGAIDRAVRLMIRRDAIEPLIRALVMRQTRVALEVAEDLMRGIGIGWEPRTTEQVPE